MGHPIVQTVTITTADPDGIALSQSRGSAGAFTLNGALVTGGVAVMDAPRRVGVTSTADDSGITFTYVGTDRNGAALTETIAGTNTGTAETTQDFATVTSLSSSAATTGSITAGTTSTASSAWVPWDRNVKTQFQVSVVGQIASGSPTWQVDITYDDVYGTWLPAGVTWPRPVVWTNLQGKTGTADDIIARPICASRLTLTVVGGVQLTQIQQGN